MFTFDASNLIYENLAYEKNVIIDSLVVILVTSTAVSLLFQRLRLAIIPAFIVAGIIAGPSMFGFAHSAPALDEISHLAVVLLLFGIGMELHLSSLRTGIWKLLATSIGSIFATLLMLWPISTLLGLSSMQGLTVAMALSLSSTAVVLKIFSLRRELATSHGQLSLAILVIQDLAALGMLALVPIIATWGKDTNSIGHNLGTVTLASGLRDAAFMIIGIFVIVFIAKKLIPLLLREALKDQSGELSMLAGVSIALLTAYGSYKLGFSLEIGAFLAGFILASSPFRFHLAGRINALRDLFMAIFFTTLGMELELNRILDHLPIILAATLALLAVKTLAIALSTWFSGSSARLSVRVALALSQAGEFSLIILSQASDYGIFSETYSSAIIAVVVLSLILTPVIIQFSPYIYLAFDATLLAPWFCNKSLKQIHDNTSNNTSPADIEAASVIIAGFGPLGRYLAEKFGRWGVHYTIVELNPETVRREQLNNQPIIFGDISDDQMLSTLNISAASTLALTFPDPNTSIQAATIARKMSAELFIIARTPTHRHEEALIKSGVDKVIVDENACADEMFSSIIATRPSVTHQVG